MRTQRSADIASGIFLAALGVVVLIAARQITGGMEERLPPRTLPYVMGFTILIPGLLLSFRAWRFKGEDPKIHWPDRTGARHVIVILVAMAVYVALITLLGMPISTGLFIAFTVWYLWTGLRGLVYGLITGILSGAVVYYLFIRFLELSFPVGFFQG
jgi:hypothetical protein